MDSNLIHSIWESRNIAFAVTDQRLTVQELHGQVEIITTEVDSWRGCSLFEIFPELIGNEQDLNKILRGELESFKLEYVNREIQGKVHYLTMEDLPYHDQGGGITGIVHLVQDISSKGELEQQITQNRNQLQLLKEQIERQNLDLMAANTELRRLSELKSDFISVAAHELRTPLTSINGFLEILLDGQMGNLTDQQRNVLEIVQQSGLRLINLTDELLNAARLESGRVDLILKPVDLAGLVKGVVSEFTGQIRSKKQSLEMQISSQLPPALCDEKWAKMVVVNLLSNATKFTPENGKISVWLGLSDQLGFLQISVKDTGVGIPVQDRKDIFSRWFRSKNTSLINPQGSGLGLYIARSLVELNGGAIWFESEPDQGSVFYVRLPVAG